MAWSLPTAATGKSLLILLVVAATLNQQQATAAHGTHGSNRHQLNCTDMCGGVSIPYPFGIGHGCFLHGDFEVTCENHRAYINMGQEGHRQVPKYRVSKINLPLGEARVHSPKGLGWSCKYTNGYYGLPDLKPGQLSLKRSYKFSSSKNTFTAIGCATVATIVGTTEDALGHNQHTFASACASFCDSKDGISTSARCAGMGCCQTNIPPNLTTFSVKFLNDIVRNPGATEFSPCSYAFVVETRKFKFHPSYAKSSNFQREHWIPIVLDWSVGTETCDKAKNLSSYACRAKNSVCIDTTNGPGYRCNCSPGYKGNPYLEGGCHDINECHRPSMYPCLNGTCTNTIGSYNCSCPAGTQSKDPKEAPCTPIPGSNHQPQVKMVIGTSVGFVFLIACTSALLIKYQNRNLEKEKERFFKHNGGHILYQQILSKQIETVILFTIEELKEATKNFDTSRELGTGGHGTVYKGILGGDKVVAVKRSKTINVAQTEEFVQEIIILSQINHRNVVRLIGCCLEVEVPILVYEYIPNGTLFHLIHNNHGRPPVSLEERLRIAQESAEALEYLHVSINHPIVHGDVKSLNILLDGNYMAKVTDFGASRLLPKDAVQLMTMVQGTLGYLDPEYLQERKLTEKSDVYSFGVVILELITTKTAIYSEGLEEGKSLVLSFLRAIKDNRVESMLDPSITGVGMEELFKEVAELASLCLSFKGEERPSMTQVADKLKAIRSTWKEILLLKHEETKCLGERLGYTKYTGSACDLPPSIYWTG